MDVRMRVPTLTGGYALIDVLPITPTLIYRQRLSAYARQLWAPTLQGRWNDDLPALYTSLSLDTALAERVKRTAARPITIVVGIAQIELRRVAVLNAATLKANLH